MRKSRIFSCVCFILGIMLLIASTKIRALWQEPMGPAVFPYILSSLLILSSAISIGHDFYLEKKNKKESKENETNECKNDDSTEDTSRSSGKSVIFVAVSAFLYVLGLTYIGFYVSTFIYVIVTIGGLSYFHDKSSYIKKTVTIGIPMAVVFVIVFMLAHKYMHIYFPSNGILW